MNRTLLLLLATTAVVLAADAEWSITSPHGATHTTTIDVREGTWMSVAVSGENLYFDLLGDIWKMPLAGGEATQLSKGSAWDIEPAISPDGKTIAFVSDQGGNEQIFLMDSDGKNQRALTHETVARLTEPVWDGDYVVARRRTVDTRSIGVTELWRYHKDGGEGIALTSKDEHPHAGEPQLTSKYLYFSSRAGRFEYNHDPLGGLWSIYRQDRWNGSTMWVAGGSGSAARPVLSPDQKSLAFVSRDRTKTLIEIMDLATGNRRVLADWLRYDQMEGFALHGVWPRMAWIDDKDGTSSIVAWSDGKLWRVATENGQRTEIPFHAVATHELHDVPRWSRTIPDTITPNIIRWPTENASKQLAFSAAGALFLRDATGNISRISPGTGYAPAWSPDGKSLAWTSWSDVNSGRLQINTGTKLEKTEILPGEGQFVNPAWSPDGKTLAVLRGPGGGTSPDLADEPYFEILLYQKDKKGWTSKSISSLPNRGSGMRMPSFYWRNNRLYYIEDQNPEPRKPEQTVLVSIALDGTDRREHLIFPEGADEIAPSPDWRYLAYKSRHNAYLTAFPDAPGPVETSALPIQPLTQEVGDWLSWSADSKTLYWQKGRFRESLAIDHINPPKDGAAPAKPESNEIKLQLPRKKPSGPMAITHARIITMEGQEVLEDATLVIDGDRILGINTPIPAGAYTIDGTGSTIIPGLIDVHAHLHYTAGDILSAQEWRYQTALDFGVTTVHDPSAATDLVFTQAEAVEAGFMEGPRVYSTGYVLYGALSNQGAETPTLEAARNHVRRMKNLGATSVKVYQQSQRDRRQWYAQACREEQILCVAEGGGDLWQNLTMYLDGYHSVEHTLPGPGLFADVQALIAGSKTKDTFGTANTPTLLVAYNALSGENWFYQHRSPLWDHRLLAHYPRRELDARAWRPTVNAQDGDWAAAHAAVDAAKNLRNGALITLGAHGQLQGLGVHWELWALSGIMGEAAMTPMEALQSATINGARYLGMEDKIGSIKAGKFADFVVLNSDPREDIQNSVDIRFTVKNGSIWQ